MVGKFEDLMEMKALSDKFKRKRSGVLYRRLEENAKSNGLAIIYSKTGKIKGFFMNCPKNGLMKHIVFIKNDKLYARSKFGTFVLDIYIPKINS